MSNVMIAILFVLVIGAGGIWLQMFLSKKENRWVGLILPFISFGISLLGLLGVVVFSAFTGEITTTVNGEIIKQTTGQIASMSSIIVTAVYVFVLYNIPTAILLAIYAACRGKRNRQRALEKMSAQDLE